MKRIAITTGDPAGIGPEIATKQLRFHNLIDDIIYIVYGKLLKTVDGNDVIKINNISEATKPKNIYWIEIDDIVETGKPSKKAGKIAFEILQKSVQDILENNIEAVVTCPISKMAIQQTIPDFIGHTEFFADCSNSSEVVMTFWGNYFNLALLTTHDSIKNIINNFDKSAIKKKLKTIYYLIKKHLINARIALLAINPHAGEHGSFGKEDIILKKILQEVKKEGVFIEGPFPSDTFFAAKAIQYDFVISLFHDQGLIPFKMLSAENGVNVTLGLPFIRTSVDHGTAFDIAGQNIASEKSFANALFFAENIVSENEQKYRTIYNDFAEYYDQYMCHVDYDIWIDFILDKYRKIQNAEPQKILEIACGTGNICNRLANSGYKIDGCDISSEMLKIAAKKSNKVKFYCADFTQQFHKKGYDLALLLFDSINYCLTEKEILLTLSSIYKSINDNALMIFDISTIKNCEENFDGFINLKDDNESYMIHQSSLDYTENILTTNLTFFIKNNFLFERKDEIHKQQIYFTKQIVKIIKQTAFNLVGIFSLKSDENLLFKLNRNLDEKYTRLYFVLKK